MANDTPGSSNSAHMNFRLPAWLRAEIARQAHDLHQSPSDFIRDAVMFYAASRRAMGHPALVDELIQTVIEFYRGGGEGKGDEE